MRRVRPDGRGRFHLRIPRRERELLRSLPAQLREVLASDDPVLERLFPPAYRDDAERDADYQGLMREELMQHRLSSVQVMEATIDESDLDQEQLLAWLGAINDIRLVLGTKLEVTEELYEEEVSPEDPRAPGLALYHYLGWLEEQVVEALSSSLPPAHRSD